MFKNSNLSPQVFHSLKNSNDLTRIRLGGGTVNKVQFEVYKNLKDDNKLGLLPTHKDTIHSDLCRNALVDNLLNEFQWDYWNVVTFGYRPHKSDIDVILSDCHYRLDRWLMTNLKLSALGISDRSKWVCIPERGSDGNLHYNIFIQLGLRPEGKSYGGEWNAMRNAFKTTFKALEKAHNSQTIHFRLKERRYASDQLRKSIYSTKEMNHANQNIENGYDNFADFIRSWKDWDVRPMNRRSKKKLNPTPKPSATLEQFI